MKRSLRHRASRLALYGVVIAVGFVLIYPLIWMFFASFKTNEEIFTATRLLPESFDPSGFVKGWRSTGQYTFTNYFINTFVLVVPTVLFTLLSCPLVAYGFARFEFPGKKIFFALMISTLMLPASVVIIPRYLVFRNLGWLDTYMPFWAPALLACYPFFIFMLVQFFRGLPLDLDEAAKIDGCNSLQTYVRIHLPLLKPALISVCIFQAMWTWNDFMNTLIYVNSVSRYPLSLALRLGIDVASTAQWNQIMAMACVSILPLVLLYFCLQKYFVEGIATSGIKG